jgi:plastocyanin
MNRATSLVLSFVLGGCGGASPPGSDAGGARLDAPAAADAPAAGAATHDCEEDDFVDRTGGDDESRMIMVPSGTTQFDYPCMTVRAGQSVMFMWRFDAHPLAPGIAPGHPGDGTEPSPIEARATGALYTVPFPTAGEYPFYCSTHFDSGMLGVVRVLP